MPERCNVSRMWRDGVLPRKWNRAGPDCTKVPPFEVHRYNDDFFILRQSGCTHYEKPFLYLLFGTERALLVDTGAGNVDVAAVVGGVISTWLAGQRRESIHLVVVHSHSHADHVAGDDQFIGQPHTTLVPPDLESVQRYFGFTNWPHDLAQYDLGERVVDVIAIPGHDRSDLALYDRQTAILLSGDTLYPGRLYVEDGAAFTASVRRLTQFVQRHPLAHILGCHIENSSIPFVDYPVGTVDQPDEHALELDFDHLFELDEALRAMEGRVVKRVMRDFTIWPGKAMKNDE